MQPYLALETSTPLGSVAIGRGGGILAEVVLGIQARASEALLPAVDFALRSAGLRPEQLAGIVVGGGPGSFTGVRIGGATAKGLVRALGVPLFAYSGLAALAAGVACEGRPVCALFDARRGEVYAGCYRFPGSASFETVLEPGVRPLAEVLERLGTAPLYVGEGAERYRTVLAEAGAASAPPHLAIPRAASLLWLAELAPAAGRVDSPAAWEPQYLRAAGAERKREG